MKASHRLSLLFLCSGAIGLPGFMSPVAGAAEAPGGGGSDAAAAAAAAPLQAVERAQWSAQTAPGSTLAPAADAERTWTALSGWVKVPVGGGESPGGHSGRSKGRHSKAKAAADGDDSPVRAPLPDPWIRGGHDYQAAWYVLRADFGERIPESLLMRFDAVAHQCEAYVNGIHVGGHLGGYTPFSLDITRAVHPGANVIALYVRDEHAVELPKEHAAISQVGVTHFGSGGSVAGICGGAYFDARPAVHSDHLLIHTSTRRKEIEVTTWLGAPASGGAVIAQEVYDWPAGPSPVLRLPQSALKPGESSSRVSLAWPNPRLWSPEHPALYVLRTTVTAGGKSETVDTRFGFREFWTEGRSFMLNGIPTRLLGTSLAHDLDLTIAGNPVSGRSYSRAVLSYYKSELNYRAIRLHASIHPPEAVQAADEVGVLCIDQSSLWSAMGTPYTEGGDALLRNTRSQFAEWFWRDANDPSVVIWDVENEMIRGAGARTPKRERWVLALDAFIKDLDPTRIVEHSGAAWYSPTQQTIHVHMQNQYSHVLQDWAASGRAPLIIGEFWVGGRNGATYLPDGREYTGSRDYFQDESADYRKKIIEMRNYGASGAMPFWMDNTTVGRTGESPRRSFDPKADKLFFKRFPGLRNLGSEALAPAIAFAWPRSESAVAGSTLEKEIVVCNDLEERTDFTVSCSYGGLRRDWQVTLGPGAQDRRRVSFPAGASGDLVVSLGDSSGRKWPGDTLSIHAIDPEREAAPRLSRQLVVMPKPTPAVAAALSEMGLAWKPASDIPADARNTILLVPPGAGRDALGRTPEGVRRYLESGGRLLVLDQNQTPSWSPVGLPFSPASAKSAPEFNMLGWPEFTRNLEYSREIPLYGSGHPAFAGLDARDFGWWNPVDGRVADDLYERPGAAGVRAGAPYRVLAGARLREDASLIEVPAGDGTAILCQAQVIEQRGHPGARALLMNLLRYLDGPAWALSDSRVGLAGSLRPAQLAALVDLPAASFVPVSKPADAPRVVLAGDHADVGLLDELARSGSTVFVLSRETSARLPGHAVSVSADTRYAGTRGGASDDPLLWGVATGSFLPLDESPAKGSFLRYPKGSLILLGGLSDESGRAAPKGHPHPIDTLDGVGPVVLGEARGNGRLIATTLEPWNPSAQCDRQLLETLLANAGVRLGSAGSGAGGVSVKATVPPVIDGRLDDWTNDLEDRNVSPYRHAQPVALSRRDLASGWSPGDSGLSAVLYLLNDSAHLYLAGIVFSSEPAVRAEFTLDGHAVVADLGAQSLAIDGRPVPGGRIAFGRSQAHEIFDTRLLSVRPDNSGTTFEAAIPWEALGFRGQPAVLGGLFSVSKEGAVLQVPSPLGTTAPRPLSLVVEKSH